MRAGCAWRGRKAGRAPLRQGRLSPAEASGLYPGTKGATEGLRAGK